MKEKIKQYLTLIKKYTLYTVLIITLISLGMRIYFHFEHFEFRTVGYKINMHSLYLMFYLIIFWLGYAVIKFIGKIGFDKSQKWYVNIVSFICSVVLSSPLILFMLLMFLAVFVLQSDNKCMEICVNDDNSNYTECMNGMCD